jgi:hypothetical protein
MSLSERALAPKEFAGEVKCFARGLQQDKVGGEDVHHALPDMKLSGRARIRQQMGVSARIVEQDLVGADVKQDRR